MRRSKTPVSRGHLLVLLLALCAAHTCRASGGLGERLWPRHAQDDATASPAGEQEATTAATNKPAPAEPAVQPAGQQPQQHSQQQPPHHHQQQPAGGLYPQLPPALAGAPGGGFLPPFNGGPAYPSPFAPPFGSTGRLQGGQPVGPSGAMAPAPPRPMTAAERLQSQSFANGLGRRLLALAGIEPPAESATSTSGAPSGAAAAGTPEETLRALQNSTVLQQLNRGVQSLYGGLSRMYNSTIREQLELLQQRYRDETANGTAVNQFQARMAEQVPLFFKGMAARVEEAQARLNQLWRDAMAANKNKSAAGASGEPAAMQAAPRSFLDQFAGEGGAGGFFDQIGRRFNGFMEPQPTGEGGTGAASNWMDQMRDFWHAQVQPQIGMVRNQMQRVWRDLTASGALSPEVVFRSRSSGPLGSGANSSRSAELADDILKEAADTNSPEYSLIGEEGAGQQQQQQQQQQSQLTSQMQKGLIQAQRELNQLWQGLTSSLQGAIGNVRNSLQQRPRDAFGRQPAPADADPAANEISGKISDLGKLQRDTDMVYGAVQQQQEAQRQSLGDRFKSFFGGVDFNGMGLEQWPNRFNQQVSHLGTAVGDLWNQIPTRWENFRQSMRPQPELNSRLSSSSTTTTTTTTPKPEK